MTDRDYADDEEALVTGRGAIVCIWAMWITRAPPGRLRASDVASGERVVSTMSAFR